MVAVVLQIDDTTAAHLARALDNHRDWCRANGYGWPDTLAALRSMVSADQSRPNIDTAVELPDHEPMAPLLLTYTDAAQRLGVSHSTVRRLVKTGRLPAVHVTGQTTRIRTHDVDAYVEALAS